MVFAKLQLVIRFQMLAGPETAGGPEGPPFLYFSGERIAYDKTLFDISPTNRQINN